MRFDDRFLEEIKSRLRLSDVIGRSVKLRRQGREYVGLSPFTKEKSPSFFVNDDKGFFHDFSSGKHGDLIGFLQETERLSFREAVERLAGEAGLALPSESPEAAAREKARQGLQDWIEAAARWFEVALRRPGGRAARDYLKARGLEEAEWSRFRLGYAPGAGGQGRTALRDHLVSKGARPGELVEAGLLVAPEDGGSPFDRFRDRIVFPIADGRGRVVSFGGRALDPEVKAKYLNGPETPLFHKGATLYGLHEARRLLHAAPSVGDAAEGEPGLVVVEGYMDAIACQRAGVAAVAPLGTALTEDQMGALWRLHPEPTLAFDADAAGQRAAHRALDRALPLLRPGRSLRFAFLTGGKDPDDVLKAQGPEALRAQLAAVRPFVEVLFDRERAAAEPLSTPERRTALKVQLRKLAGQIADGELAGAYRDDLLARFSRAMRPSSEELRQASDTFYRARSARAYDRRSSRSRLTPGGPTPEGRAAVRALSASIRPIYAAAVQAVLMRPELIDLQFETLDAQGFGDPALREIASEIIRVRLSNVSLDRGELERHLAQGGHAEGLREIARAAGRSRAPFLQPDLPPGLATAAWMRVYASLIEIAALERALEDAKAELSYSRADFNEISALKTQRDARRRELGSGAVWSEAAATLH